MKDRFTLPVLLLVFVVLAASIVAAGCVLYRSQRDSCRTEAEHRLAAVADLKVGELSMWRKERLGDANVFYKNNAFSGLVRRSIERPQDLPLQEELRCWISRVQASYHYDRIALLDAAGNKLMMVSDTGEPLSTLTYQKAREAQLSGQVTFVDFYPNEYNQKVYFRLFVPIFDGQAGRRPLGVLMLRIDPNAYLYPFIQRWPTPSETAETLLIRREGNQAVFLNELKFQKNTALALRVPLNSTDLPAVKAALGQHGIVEGVDYRGVPVLAAVRAVANSPWFLVAKIDAAEVFAPMRERLWLTVLFVGTLLFGAAAAVGFLWRQQHLRLYREKYEAEHKYRNLFESSRDAMTTAEPPSWKFTAGNPAMVEMFRLKNARELTTLGPWDISPERQPDGRVSGEKAKEMIETAVREGSHLFEWTHKRIDGEEFPATVLLTRVVQAGKVVVQATVRDITEQKHAEESLQAAKYDAEASQAQYEQTVAMISDIVWRVEVDGQGQLVSNYISPVADRLLGLPAGTIGNSLEKFYSCVHPDELPTLQETLFGGLCGLAKDATAEYRLRRPDGTTLWVRSKGSAYLQADGHIVGFGTTSDITDASGPNCVSSISTRSCGRFGISAN